MTVTEVTPEQLREQIAAIEARYPMLVGFPRADCRVGFPRDCRHCTEADVRYAHGVDAARAWVQLDALRWLAGEEETR
jgi:hypothetical protein